MPGKVALASSGQARKSTTRLPDFDPEDEVSSDDSGSVSQGDSADRAGETEHYVEVAESKLRNRTVPNLGPKYLGATISRAALDDSDDSLSGGDDDNDEEVSDEVSDSEGYDNPADAELNLDADEIDADEEIDSDDAFGEGDDERYKEYTFRGSAKQKGAANGAKKSKRPTAADFYSSGDEDVRASFGSDEEESDEDMNDADEDVDLEDGSAEDAMDGDDSAEDVDELLSDENDQEDEGDEEDDDSDHSNEHANGIRDQMQRVFLEDAANGGSFSLQQTASADARKGQAVRQQQKIYDSLLNLRIRLQKGLVAANTFNTTDAEAQDDDQEALQAAETAALNLLDTISNLRQDVDVVKAAEKRPLTLEPSSSSKEIWDELNDVETRALKKRRKTLNHWSDRVKKEKAELKSTRQLGPAASQSLLNVLDDQLMNTDHLVQRTKIPRSCAPVQAAAKTAQDENVFDDADFYQLMLKQLVDSRNGDSATPLPTVQGWAAIKEAKTRKQVDRKASKGRKLRFTVHEKLQNFMAPEDRRTWEDDAIDRLFATLFGQKAPLSNKPKAAPSLLNGDADAADFPLFSR